MTRNTMALEAGGVTTKALRTVPSTAHYLCDTDLAKSLTLHLDWKGNLHCPLYWRYNGERREEKEQTLNGSGEESEGQGSPSKQGAVQAGLSVPLGKERCLYWLSAA
ncbi:hypothetical protein H920_01042 [Fukomys damarensis]|uniref:Uncharacterized protein n=1 Tax=Fukomys damarensis TaxID=885580 RepID=A0A091E2I4_FUKDA|nr:hypothetical protein H920_01042 [Fukomys damarensis]